MKKIIFLTIFLITILNGLGQNVRYFPISNIGISTNGNLFKDTEYTFSILSNVTDTLIFETKNCDIIQDTTFFLQYSFISKNVGTSEIIVYAKGEKRKYCLGHYIFKIVEKPSPTVFIGNIPSGNRINIDSLTLNCKYQSDYVINEKFEILSVSIRINEKVIDNKSNVLSDIQTEFLKKLKANSLFEIELNIKSQEGKSIKVIGIFKR